MATIRSKPESGLRLLDRIAMHILAFEGDGTAVWFAGNYGEYEEDRRKRLGRRPESST